MADSYVDGKVREALIQARGNRTLAQRTLIAWAADDHKLLLGMAAPFLKAIAGAAVERVWRRGTSADPAESAGRPGASLSRDALQSVISQIGRGAAPPPSKPGAPAAPDRLSLGDVMGGGNAQGGREQASAIKTLANAYLEKKFRR